MLRAKGSISLCTLRRHLTQAIQVHISGTQIEGILQSARGVFANAQDNQRNAPTCSDVLVAAATGSEGSTGGVEGDVSLPHVASLNSALLSVPTNGSARHAPKRRTRAHSTRYARDCALGRGSKCRVGACRPAASRSRLAPPSLPTIPSVPARGGSTCGLVEGSVRRVPFCAPCFAPPPEDISPGAVGLRGLRGTVDGWWPSGPRRL